MDNSTFRNQVNASGFPFQLRVEHEVVNTYDSHKWRPIARERRWINKDSGAEGFIDLVLENANHFSNPRYMVIECKRVRGGSWIFLTPRDYSQKRSDAHVLITHRQSSKENPPIWVMKHYTPQSPLSSFCTVPGQGDKDTPMLERVSGTLIDSLESLATEQLNVGPQITRETSELRAFYFPIIVTNSELFVCEFDMDDINLSEGILDEKSGEFQSVPFIRFQKGLTSRYPTNQVGMTIEEISKENQRTVLIVHAPYFPTFLSLWEVW